MHNNATSSTNCTIKNKDTHTNNNGATKDLQSITNDDSKNKMARSWHNLHIIGDAWFDHLRQLSRSVVLQMDNLDDALMFGIRLSTVIKAKQFNHKLLEGQVFGCDLLEWIKVVARHGTPLTNLKPSQYDKNTENTAGKTKQTVVLWLEKGTTAPTSSATKRPSKMT